MKHKKTRIRRQRKLGEPPEDVKPETVGDDRKDEKTYRGHTLESDTKGGKYTSGEGSEKEFANNPKTLDRQKASASEITKKSESTKSIAKFTARDFPGSSILWICQSHLTSFDCKKSPASCPVLSDDAESMPMMEINSIG